MIAFFKKVWSNLFLRYSIIGFGRWVLGTAIMFVLYNWCGCGYWFSSACNNVISNLILGYVCGYLVIFPDQKASVLSAVKYAALALSVYLVSYSLAPLVIRPLEQRLADWAAAYIGAKYAELLRGNVTLATGMVLHMGLNYLGQRFFVFPAKKKKTEE